MNKAVKKQNLQRNKIEEVTFIKDIPRPLSEHLKELRTRGSIVLLTFLLLSGVGYLIRDTLISLLILPLHGPIYYTSPSGGLEVIFKISLLFGTIFTIPIFLYHLFGFLKPLLPIRFTRLIPRILLVSFLLLILGIIFAYKVLLPSSLRFLTMFGSDQVRSFITADNYLSFMIRYLLGFAVIFQLPLFIIVINSLYKLPARTLLSFSRIVILASFIVAAILTPTPDVFNQSLLALPIIILYMGSAGIIFLLNRKL